MILNDLIEVTIINHNIEHYRGKGYNVKCRDKILVKPEELSSGSHCVINCKCDNCDKETHIKYQDYLKIFNKNLKYVCQECYQKIFSNYNNTKKFIMKENRAKSINQKYGVDNVFQLESVKEKMKETFIKNYGFDSPKKSPQVQEILKQNRIKNGTQIPDEKLSEFELYKKKVLHYTRINKKILYKNWNGLDYYDNDLIIENKKLHFNNDLYPNVDHKISIKKGFRKNIEPSIIGSLDNLCITKRINNLSKGSIYKKPKRLYEKI